MRWVEITLWPGTELEKVCVEITEAIIVMGSRDELAALLSGE